MGYWLLVISAQKRTPKKIFFLRQRFFAPLRYPKALTHNLTKKIIMTATLTYTLLLAIVYLGRKFYTLKMHTA